MAKLLNLETSENNNRDLVQIGKITRAHGIKGELKVIIYLEFLFLLENIKSLYIEQDEYFIENIRMFKENTFIFKFLDLNSIDDVKPFSNLPVFILKEDIYEDKKALNNVFMLEDLEGFAVIDQQDIKIGNVVSFYKTDFYSYIELDTGELIPFIKEHIKKIDKESRSIKVHWETDYEI